MKRKQQDDDDKDGVEKLASSAIVATSMNTSDIVLQSSPKLSQKQDYIFHGG